VIGVYALAAAINLLIPRLPPEHALDRFDAAGLLREFIASVKSLWREQRCPLQPHRHQPVLGHRLHPAPRPFRLGAGGAGHRQQPDAGQSDGGGVRRHRPRRRPGRPAGPAGNREPGLAGGLLLGPLVMLLAWQNGLIPTALVLAGIGLAGGFFVVPLNALLQERGHESVGAGHALAVQNLWENLAMLGFVGAYALAEGLPVVNVVTSFGVAVLAGISVLAVYRFRGSRPG
jgi:LPLT family lysophospholipid transporter-like MFS transporter